LNLSPARRNTSLRNTFRTLFLTGLGGALENFDFIVFVMFIKVIAQLFFPPDIPTWVAQLQTFAIFATGNLVRPVGAIVLAHFGDKLGRKRTFSFSIWLMAIATLGIAVTPTFATIGAAAPALLLLLRILQGIALGGELPGAWTFISEHAPRGRTGFVCGIVMALLALGHLLGIFSATVVFRLFSSAEVQAFAWRLPFLFGAALAIIAGFRRRWLTETPVFEEMLRKNQLATELPLKMVLRSHLRGVLISVALGWLFTSVIIVLLEMTPTLLQTVYGIPVNSALEASTVATLFLAASYPVSGLLSDLMGRGLFLVIGVSLLAVCIYLFFTLLPAYSNFLFPLYALTCVSASVITGFLPVMIESFPAAIRFTGVAFSYSVAYAFFGGLMPPLIAFGLRFSPLAHMYALLFSCLVVFVVGIVFLVSAKPKAMLPQTSPEGT